MPRPSASCAQTTGAVCCVVGAPITGFSNCCCLSARSGWTCRYDLGLACCLALGCDTDFDVLHVVEWTPEGVPEPAALCNVEHAQEVLGLSFRGNLARFQPASL